MEEHYVVVRTATNTEGGTASTATVRNTRLLAEQLYHEQLADAARQGRPCDAVTLLDMRGFVLKTEHYEVVPEPEPEPDPEIVEPETVEPTVEGEGAEDE